MLTLNVYNYYVLNVNVMARTKGDILLHGKKRICLKVKVSDMEHMGAVILNEKLVEQTLLSKKFESSMLFEDTLYYIYVRYGFYSGARISGIAVPLYINREYALLACKRLNENYQRALKRNQNNIRLKQRKCLWGELAVHAIFFVVAVLFFQRMVFIMNNGTSVISFIVSIIYSYIITLCCVIHYRLR